MADKEIISIDLSSDSDTENSAPKKSDKNDGIVNATETNPPNQNAGSGKEKKTEIKKSSQEDKCKRFTRTMKKLSIEDQFMGRFDPENSNREKRKLIKKYSIENSPKTGHDEFGSLMETSMNLCDCLNENCVGCFFPCRSCRSCKCGVECRNNRKWIIESVENEADHTLIKNPCILKQQHSKT